jgi:hypothetical protein
VRQERPKRIPSLDSMAFWPAAHEQSALLEHAYHNRRSCGIAFLKGQKDKLQEALRIC